MGDLSNVTFILYFIGDNELHSTSGKLQEEKDGSTEAVGWFFRQPSNNRWDTSQLNIQICWELQEICFDK